MSRQDMPVSVPLSPAPKVRAAEGACNSRDPVRVTLADSADSI